MKHPPSKRGLIALKTHFLFSVAQINFQEFLKWFEGSVDDNQHLEGRLGGSPAMSTAGSGRGHRHGRGRGRQQGQGRNHRYIEVRSGRRDDTRGGDDSTTGNIDGTGVGRDRSVAEGDGGRPTAERTSGHDGDTHEVDSDDGDSDDISSVSSTKSSPLEPGLSTPKKASATAGRMRQRGKGGEGEQRQQRRRELVTAGGWLHRRKNKNTNSKMDEKSARTKRRGGLEAEDGDGGEAVVGPAPQREDKRRRVDKSGKRALASPAASVRSEGGRSTASFGGISRMLRSRSPVDPWRKHDKTLKAVAEQEARTLLLRRARLRAQVLYRINKL